MLSLASLRASASWRENVHFLDLPGRGKTSILAGQNHGRRPLERHNVTQIPLNPALRSALNALRNKLLGKYYTLRKNLGGKLAGWRMPSAAVRISHLPSV